MATPPSHLIRNLSAGQLLETFLVSAVGSVLAVRLYLHLTGYPQLGGDSLHFAHMLWGGLLMLVAMVMLLSFLGGRVLRLSAVIGGIGFGIFIDELGKFITKDNDYFFQPTIALLYVIFICLFFVFRAIDQRQSWSPQDYLVNALHLMEEAALQNLDEGEQQQILSYLDQSDQSNPITQELRRLVTTINLVPVDQPPLWVALASQGRERIVNIMQRPWFDTLLSTYFLFWSFLLVGEALVHTGNALLAPQPWHGLFPERTFIALGHLSSSILASSLIVLGAIRLRTSRLQALVLFQRSTLVSLFLTQFFAFYREQLSAVFALFANLVLLWILRYLIDREKEAASRK